MNTISQDVKASDIFGFAMSKEVVLRFDYPIHFDQCWFRANQNYANFYRNDNQGSDPTLYAELWGDDQIMYARREFDAEDSDWQRVVLPPRGMANIKKIVISQGLEVDSMRLYMEIPVQVRYVTYMDKDFQDIKKSVPEHDIHIIEKDKQTSA